MPVGNAVSRRQWRKFIERSRRENDYFGLLKSGGMARGFLQAVQIRAALVGGERNADFGPGLAGAWPKLLRQIEADELAVIKRGASGEVLAGEVELGGRRIAVVVKRPFKRYWYRYVNEIGRGSRAWRAWNKAWRWWCGDIPTAWPLAVMQKRVLGYITDSVIVLERVEGSVLAHADLDAMQAKEREMLMRRTGGILRQIDELGLSHFDAKATNWIVQEDAKLGARPVLVDVDGIRFRSWRALGIERLLRAMRDHPQYTVADSLALCQGYAPFSLISREGKG